MVDVIEIYTCPHCYYPVPRGEMKEGFGFQCGKCGSGYYGREEAERCCLEEE